MSTVTNLQLWRDPGYTEGCYEVPAIGSSLPTADLTISSNLNPSKDRMFSEFRIQQDYETLYDMCYLRAVYTMNNGSSVTMYGWIDSVEVQSDTEDYPITIVNWHIDYWRTFISRAEFGSGFVKKRSYTTLLRNDDVPIQNVPYRYKYLKLDEDYAWNLIPSGTVDGWVYWTFQRRAYSNNNITQTSYACAPVKMDGSTVFISEYDEYVPYLNRFIEGSAFAGMNIDPESVNSVWFSVCPPSDYTGTGTSDSPIVISSGEWQPIAWTNFGELDSPNYVFFEYANRFSSQAMFSEIVGQTFDTGKLTSETDEYIITDMSGNPVGSLPWGFGIPGNTDSVYSYRMVLSTTSAYIQVRFRALPLDSSIIYASEPYLASMGLTVNIPCVALDVAESAYSSYVYSGARQADIEQRKLASVDSLVSGLTGAGTGGLTGGLIGSASGMAGVGAVAGAATSLIGAGAGYAYETLYSNDKAQEIEDYRYANQSNRILMYGDGSDALFHGQSVTMYRLRIDDYSREQYEARVELQGYSVDEPTASCQSLIEAGGPLQIQNLIVGGDIPAAAKQYIRQRFAGGVRMI